MKKIIAILMTLVTVLFLVGCDPESFYYNYDELMENVIGIELINYNNPDAKELFEQRDKVLPFDFDKSEIIESLPKEKFDGFLKELSEFQLLKYWSHMNSPNGKCLKLNYKNGDFDIIACDVQFSCKFYADGSIKMFIGSSRGYLNVIINEYFNTKVDLSY